MATAAAKPPRICGTCCRTPARPGQGTCRECHNAYMKRWRDERVFVPRGHREKAAELEKKR